jgi:hypothetical protein
MADGWGGRRSQALRAKVLATYGPLCWLCNGPIAAGQAWDVDHVRARSRCPNCQGARWCEDCNRIENLRPAHAGRTGACLGNRARGADAAMVWQL